MRRSLSQQVRQAFGLREVILVDRRSNTDSVSLGRALARVSAGYFNQCLIGALQGTPSTTEIRVGISWGWGTREVLRELIRMAVPANGSPLLESAPQLDGRVVWSPLLGTLTAEITDREASSVAEGLRAHYGGRVEGFPCAGFARDATRIPKAVEALIGELERAEILLTSATAWTPAIRRDLYRRTGLNPRYFPPPGKAVCLMAGVFLDARGRPVHGDYTVVGIGFDGLASAAARGKVILMCGGNARKAAVLAALRARLVSSLITTTDTGRWLIQQLT